MDFARLMTWIFTNSNTQSRCLPNCQAMEEKGKRLPVQTSDYPPDLRKDHLKLPAHNCCDCSIYFRLVNRRNPGWLSAALSRQENAVMFTVHYIILNNGILKSNSSIFPRSKRYITQYTP